MSPVRAKNLTLTFLHEDGRESMVKTEVVKMLGARLGGKLTISQQQKNGEGIGTLYIGSSTVHNPTTEQVSLISTFNWSSDKVTLLEDYLVTFPFLVLSADFKDNKLAEIEVEVSFSWSPYDRR